MSNRSKIASEIRHSRDRIIDHRTGIPFIDYDTQQGEYYNWKTGEYLTDTEITEHGLKQYSEFTYPLSGQVPKDFFRAR